MLLNYFKLGIRLMIRNPFFSTINVAGLAIGFVAFFGLWEFSTTELKSDRHHSNYDRIARLCIDWQWTDDGGRTWDQMIIARSGAGTVYRISQDFPEVQDFVRIYHQAAMSSSSRVFGHPGPGLQVAMLKYERPGIDPVVSREVNGAYADPNLFEFFSIPLLSGSPGTVLREKNSIALSRSRAIKFFGDADPLNEVLILNDSLSLTVTGVFEDLPHNTHLDFDFVISNRGIEHLWNLDPWSGSQNYVRLSNAEFEKFASLINFRKADYFAEVLHAFPNAKAELIVQPLTEIAFSTDFSVNDFTSKRKDVLIVLAIVAVLVLTMAWANYINLSVSRISGRIKEIATRKVSGAVPKDFVLQFLIEAFLYNVLAIGLAVTLLQFVRQAAKDLLDIHLPQIGDFFAGSFVFFGVVMLVSVLATGTYPAIISRAFSPRSLFQAGKKFRLKGFIPSLMTTGQYVTAVVLIFCGIIVHQQLNHVINTDPGFNISRVFMVNAPIVRTRNYARDLQLLADQMNQKASVLKSTLGTLIIDLGIRNEGSNTPIYTDGLGVFESFIPFYDIPLLAGRNFQIDDRKDAVILSHIAVERLGFQNMDDVIGKRITMAYQGYNQEWRAMEVVGVIADFRTRPLYTAGSNTEAWKGRGYSLIYGSKQFPEIIPDALALRLRPGETEAQMDELKATYEQIFPGNIFGGFFFDEWLERPYQSEKITRNQITFFIAIAMIIVCLGLLGMISNKVAEKFREIGIRKALGASLSNIAHMLLKSTFVQVLLALCIGIPVAGYLSLQYLQKYAEQITIEWWHYLVPAVILSAVLFGTVSFVLVRVVRTSPVDSLRYVN